MDNVITTDMDVGQSVGNNNNANAMTDPRKKLRYLLLLLKIQSFVTFIYYNGSSK